MLVVPAFEPRQAAWSPELSLLVIDLLSDQFLKHVFQRYDPDRRTLQTFEELRLAVSLS